MARKIHRGFYRTKAARHERAARASSGSDAEGHREVARGYHRLARGKGGSTTRSGLGDAFGRSRKRRKKARRTKKHHAGGRKHRRTAKQRAATKRMIAANKRRRRR